MNRQYKILAALFIAALFSLGCNPGGPTPTVTCNQNNTQFQTEWAGLLAANPSAIDEVSMDLQTHEYTFTLNANKSVCAIGYTGNANLYSSNTPYKIEIYNNTDGALVFSQNIVFNSGATDYQTINSISLIAGKSYTISRTIVAGAPDIIGRILWNNDSLAFPSSSGIMTITGSAFRSTNGIARFINKGLPYIDLVFSN